MSHFIGLVFVNTEENDLEYMLAPFNEQDEEYMEFVDKTDEVKGKWDKMPETCPTEGTFIEEIDRTDFINEIWDNAADTLPPEDEEKFWKPYTKDKYPTPADIAKDKDYEVVPDETKRDGVRFVQKYESKWEYEPNKEKYPTMDKLAKEYFGYRKVNGKYGYMSNPNAKWDWYAIGNRWDGYIYGKDEKEYNELAFDEIDWEKMFEDNIPFCLVDTNGDWHERGEMGWWACVSNEKDQDDWDEEVKEYVKHLTELPDEERNAIVVYAVDFHI